MCLEWQMYIELECELNGRNANAVIKYEENKQTIIGELASWHWLQLLFVTGTSS